MSVRVEFYGMARQRAGAAQCELDTAGGPLCLSQILRRLENQYPALVGVCLRDGQLCSGYIANLDGLQFVRDPATPVQPGQAVLILSADAGG